MRAAAGEPLPTRLLAHVEAVLGPAVPSALEVERFFPTPVTEGGIGPPLPFPAHVSVFRDQLPVDAQRGPGLPALIVSHSRLRDPMARPPR